MAMTAIHSAAGVASPNTHSVAISDAKSSALVEAVVALNMETSPATPKRPLAAPIQVEGPKDVDSGYASKSATPEDSNFGPFVVANTHLLSLKRRKKTKLTHFEKEIPKLTQNRFEDLRELYADSLNNLASGLSKRRGILMTLKVLGESEDTAEPWVFIQCDKAIAKKIRRFFTKSSVISDFKPLNPNIYTPKLDIYVHELPPLLLGGKQHRSPTPTNPARKSFETLELYYERDSNAPYSLCGSKVVVSVNGHWRSATIGGLISVETAEGYIQDFGITAGHFLNDECRMEAFDGTGQEEQEEEDELTDDDTDDEFSDYEQDFELDLSLMEEPASIASVHKTADQWRASSDLKASIGYVFWTSQKNLQDDPNLDWALFTIKNNALKLPNIVVADEITRISTEDIEEPRAVVLSTASCGKIHGTLSSSWSYLTLTPGNGLVRTKAVKFSRNQALAPGDSGAWVVDSVSNQLYGHVVASDVFGISYIVPASDVLKDIQHRLSLQAVKLPIFEAHVQSTNGLSQEQVSKTLSNSLKAVDLHQKLSEESGSGHQLSSEDGLPAEAEHQSIARQKNLPSPPSHSPSLDSSKVNITVSAFDEPQQHRAENKSEMRHMKPVMENHQSISWSPIMVTEAAQIASPSYLPTQTFIEQDDPLQRRRISRKLVAVPEASASSPDALKGINTVYLRAPVLLHEHGTSSATKPETLKSKDNILVRAFRRLRRRQKSPEAAHAAIVPSSKVTTISSTDMNSKDYPTVPLSHLQPPPVPVERFSDSGYSTMANTPAASKQPTPQPSPPWQMGEPFQRSYQEEPIKISE